MNTRAQLKEYILRKLGAPLVSVEIDDSHMNDIISDTIKEFSEFAYNGELLEYIKVNCTGAGEYTISSNVQAITNLSKGNNFFVGNSVKDGFVSDEYTKMITNNVGDAISQIIHISTTSSIIQSFFGDEVNYKYNPSKRKLYIYENYVGPLLMEAYLEYTPEDTDEIYGHDWVKKMCVAQARLQQSVITGKFDGTLIGGARINYDNMRSLAEQEIESLKEELLNKYSGPAPIMVG